MTKRLEAVFEFITTHHAAVVGVMLLSTAIVGAGITQIPLGGGGDLSSVGEDTQTVQTFEYVQSAYVNETSRETNETTAVVYVRSNGGNALSKDALVATLVYQRTVLSDPAVESRLTDRGVSGVATLVGKRLAGDPDATVDEQITAIRNADQATVERTVEQTLTTGSPALSLLPADYEPGTASAQTHRMVFTFRGEEASGATEVLYETATETDSPTLFTLGEHARETRPDGIGPRNLLGLVLPFSLTAILLVLAFVYRDPIDVLMGVVGIVTSLVWTFGLIGWFQIPASLSVVIAPVLVVGLSVDYGLHLFMRYREERDADGGIRAPMKRSAVALSGALAMVTLTAVVGFMSNVVTPLSSLRQLAFGITMGVVATFVVSLLLLPALKVTVDSVLERLGVSRRKEPLGDSRLLRPVLTAGVTVARRAAPLVLVFGLIVGAGGAAAWTDLDRQTNVQGGGDVAEWKKNLPDPIGWTTPSFDRRLQYVQDRYLAAETSERRQSSVVLEPDGAETASSVMLTRVRAVHEAADDNRATLTRGGSTPVESPLTVMRAVAEENETFAAVFRDADTNGDGVPDRNVGDVYDALFAAAPDQASRVIDRTNDGYRSVRVIVPISPDVDTTTQGKQMRALAATVDTDAVTVTAVGEGTVNAARGGVIADGILQTMVVALTSVVVLLIFVYRWVVGSASFGFVTGVPIALVTASVIGGMWLLDITLTVNTALLLSLVIGLGIDYNIHVSDRFAQEIEDGQPVGKALTTATVGTGGALLGSTLTTIAAFSALLIAPFPVIQNFGTLTTLALLLSFAVAVFVLPSLIVVWTRYVPWGGVESIRSDASTTHDG